MAWFMTPAAQRLNLDAKRRPRSILQVNDERARLGIMTTWGCWTIASAWYGIHPTVQPSMPPSCGVDGEIEAEK